MLRAMKEIIRLTLSNLQTGIRKLSTPAGIISLAPLFISAIAYARSSVELTRLTLFINEPIVLEVEGIDMEDGIEIQRWGAKPFEFFLAVSGPIDVFVSRIVINITQEKLGAEFSRNCNYTYEKEQDGSAQIIPPYKIQAKALNRQYPYNLKSGFVLSSNSVLPLSGIIEDIRDEREDTRIKKAMGIAAEKPFDGNQLEFILSSNASTEFVVCISGTAFVSGTTANSDLWVGRTTDKDVVIGVIEDRLGAPPVAPGGEKVPPLWRKRIVVAGDQLQSGVELFSHRSINLF